MSRETIQRVFIVPDYLRDQDLEIIRLKHPRIGSDILCTLDSSNKLCEIIHYKDDLSSWFVEESVSEDGSLFFLTLADPLFFILPYAQQHASKFCPLEDILMDENYPDINKLSKCCNVEELRNIFDFKESSGYEVFCYNNTSTLRWLQNKAKVLSPKLESNEVNLSDGSKAASLQTNDVKSKEECLIHACHFISEYISDVLTGELFSSLGIELKKETKNEKCNGAEIKSKKQNSSVKPEDDYSKKFNMKANQEKPKTKLTTAQKQLMKVDKSGMKSISSFFQRK